MRDYFLFGNNGNTVRVNKTVSGQIRFTTNGTADFSPDQLRKQLRDLLQYLESHATAPTKTKA